MTCTLHIVAGSLSWRDVEHWLWPLFSESWQRWRRYALGLPPVPFLAAAAAATPLPPPPRLLYGVPESVVPRPGYWPDAALLCGFWRYTQVREEIAKEMLEGPPV